MFEEVFECDNGAEVFEESSESANASDVFEDSLHSNIVFYPAIFSCNNVDSSPF